MNVNLFFCLIKAYIKYVFQELFSFWVYVNAVFVGVVICFLSGNYSVVPFVVPLFVQVLVKSNIKYRNRNIAALIELPAEINDPVFILNEAGDILLSTGKTQQLFESFQITNISQFIGKDGLKKVLGMAQSFSPNRSIFPKEVYSEKNNKWYEVKAKPAHSDTVGMERILVWFTDISLKKSYDKRLQDLLSFSGSLISKLEEIKKRGDVFDQLANFILADYQAVFITKTDEEGNLKGNVFKLGAVGKEKSKLITVPKGSIAPIFVSRRESKVISGDLSSLEYGERFEVKYPFDKQVLDFIKHPVKSFITYNVAEISIIAFNFNNILTNYEKRFIEVLLNISLAIVKLVDLAQENDEQFVQKIMGLCAAAEYTDENSGKHVLRVNELSRFIAEKLGMPTGFVETIGQVAALHDIGKVAMPDLIKTSDDYTVEDRLRMQMHTIFGASIIDSIMMYAMKQDPRLITARNIALHHHQLYNGKGYPKLLSENGIVATLSKDHRDYLKNKSLTGDQIPIEGLIVAMADRYDALRTHLKNQGNHSHAEAMSIMQRDDRLGITGKEWHGPELWSLFEKYHSEFDRIYSSLQD